MSTVVLEVSTWDVSEAYKANTDLVRPGMELMRNLKGVQKLVTLILIV